MSPMTSINLLTPARLEDIAERIFRPDVLPGDKCLNPYRRKIHLEPEKDLILVGLVDAVRAIGHSPLPGRRSRGSCIASLRNNFRKRLEGSSCSDSFAGYCDWPVFV